MSGDGHALRTDELTLHTILGMGYAAYERRHPLPAHVRRAVWALLACRSALRGGHVQVCPDGHIERVWDHSCRHRLCLPWAWVPGARWLAKQQARLLAGDHYQVILTMPHELNALWRANGAVMTQLLCTSVQDTRCELVGDAKYLGARPGIIATLQTWTQTLLLHPPSHCLVTGGGQPGSGPWVAVSNGFLLPMRVVMALFRGKLRAAMRQGLVHGTLQVPVGKRRQQVENLLNKRGRQQWNVHIRERYSYGQGCGSIWPATCAAGPSPTGDCSLAMASRWSSGRPRGPKALGARRSGGRWADPLHRASGVGSSMGLRSGP
jgi:hypothetical protein